MIASARNRLSQELDAGQLYKVDIPDEAILRMLDWDKPLSDQAPEIVNALKQGYKDSFGVSDRYLDDVLRPDSNVRDAIGAGRMSKKMVDNLKAAGIPGIRYLDGSSRGTGQGTSNFVLFDDQMPRILEVNGQPTGLLSWADEAKKAKK